MKTENMVEDMGMVMVVVLEVVVVVAVVEVVVLEDEEMTDMEKVVKMDGMMDMEVEEMMAVMEVEGMMGMEKIMVEMVVMMADMVEMEEDMVVIEGMGADREKIKDMEEVMAADQYTHIHTTAVIGKAAVIGRVVGTSHGLMGRHFTMVGVGGGVFLLHGGTTGMVATGTRKKNVSCSPKEES